MKLLPAPNFEFRLRRVLRAGALLAACCVPAAMHVPGGTQNLPSLGDTERGELSPVMERRLGEQIMHDIRRDRDYLDDGPLLEYLNNFGLTLLEAAPEARGEANYDYFFFAVRDPALNAFALPGGFIGVHSALILTAQNESELASVLAHEIGHVAQRHIARILGKQRQDALIPLGAALLAILAARSSPDASAALLVGGQGVALQRQLNFSRDAEREADRVGLQILQNAGFETEGMVAFFGRMQNATRAYSDSVPVYLRSHPLTTERIADIQTRTSDQRYRQRADSLDFHLIKARLRVLQNPTEQGLGEAAGAFETQLRQKVPVQVAAAKYGMALIALRQGAFTRAEALLQEAEAAAKDMLGRAPSYVLAALSIDIRLAAGKIQEALAEAVRGRSKFPLSRGMAHQYAEVLMAASRYDDAISFLRDQIQSYRRESRLQQLLAKAYAGQGRQALQHLALAESYALTGSLPAAIDQLGIARRSGDASFHDQAVIDAREREFKARWMEELKEAQRSR